MDGEGLSGYPAVQSSELAGVTANQGVDTQSPVPSTAALPDRSSDLLSALTAPRPTTTNGSNGLKDAEKSEEAAVEDLWSSILNSVKSNKAVPTRNIVLLGEPKTGKSTLLSMLASSSPSGFINQPTGAGADGANATAGTADGLGPGDDAEGASRGAPDLGLGYGYFDIGDEDGDDIVARIGVYQLSSSHSAYISLLPLAFLSNSGPAVAPSRTKAERSVSAATPAISLLSEALILITLDWTAPWTFLDQLRTWLDVLGDLVDTATNGAATGSSRKREASGTAGTPADTKKWHQASIVLEEMRERLETYIRSYVEPSSAVPISSLGPDDPALTGGNVSTQDAIPTPAAAGSVIMPVTIGSSLERDSQLPLGDGTLTTNWGLPIVVVCTKADTTAKLDRERNFREEQFDSIQQILRTVCLKYGAALFYTARSRPESVDILRAYLLHRLFTPTHHGGSNTSGAVTGTAGAVSTAFPFTHRASTVERETVLVPSGWDTWGKIGALREGADCKNWGLGWEFDCEVERLRRSRDLPKSKDVESNLMQEVAMGEEPRGSAVQLYEDMVSDLEGVSFVDPSANRVTAPDEQAFLANHFATLQKDPDPRSKFTRASNGGVVSASSGSAGAAAARSAVGPMGSGALLLPSIEKAISSSAEGSKERAGEPSSDKERPPRLSTRDREVERSAHKSSRRDPARMQRLDSPSPGGASLAGMSSPNGSGSPGANPKQSEVLSNFFQSLLKDTSSRGVSSTHSPRIDRRAAGGATSSAKSSNGPAAASPPPRPSSSSPVPPQAPPAASPPPQQTPARDPASEDQ